MTGFRCWAHASACVTLCICACGPEALRVDYGCGGLDPGALVVTEVHANPEGADGDGEYIELFNGGPASVSVAGVTVAAGRSDGSGVKSHRVLEGSVAANGYFVLGNASGEAIPEHLDYSYGGALGSLRNSDGSVSVWCGEQLLDAVNYAKTTDGRALELDGRLSPDHEANDDAAAWCPTPEGAGALGDGNFGTPGRRNTPCESTPRDGTCIDGELVRSAVEPVAEDVRITEWMANPGGLDAELEWVEVSFAAGADLRGFQLGPSEEKLSIAIAGEDCFPVDAGARVVFGASPAAAPRVDAELEFSLGNSGARSIVAALDGVVLDLVRYEDTTEGRAWQIDEGGELCLADATWEYAPENFGTPGEANPICPPELGIGMCFDGGVPRPIVSAEVGDARITEWMADPQAAENRAGEWVEIQIDAPIDLNGLTLSDLSGSATSIDSERCLAASAGSHVVLVRNLDASVNGGIVDASAELSVSLNNRDETLTLSVNGSVLDSVTYARAEPGVATQVDDAGAICAASTPYGDGDMGTPGLPNPWCV